VGEHRAGLDEALVHGDDGGGELGANGRFGAASLDSIPRDAPSETDGVRDVDEHSVVQTLCDV
jgi:hypothetical protein